VGKVRTTIVPVGNRRADDGDDDFAHSSRNLEQKLHQSRHLPNPLEKPDQDSSRLEPKEVKTLIGGADETVEYVRNDDHIHVRIRDQKRHLAPHPVNHHLNA